MKVYAFVFARGGSKTLPRKNVKLLSGKPLIQYSIETAQQTSMVDKIFLSTEDEEIAKVGKNLGAIIIPRPEELSSDTAPEWLAWRHAVNHVLKLYGDFDFFISLPPTSPLRASNDITAAVTKLISHEAEICISVTPSNRNPYFNIVKHNDKGFCELIAVSNESIQRRQDAPKAYDITTVVYATTPKYIKEKSGIFEGRVVSIEIPKERAIDIDDIIDFKVAEAMITVQDEINA